MVLTQARLIFYGALFAIVAMGLVGVYQAGKMNERDRMAVKLAKALEQRDEAERENARRMKVMTDAYTAELDRRARSAAAARADVERLRRAAADADAASAPAGPAADGAGARPGDLLAACGAELARMGEDASRLAARVIGLQQYARLAEETCGVARDSRETDKSVR